MGINPAMLFKVKGAWERFASNHPKFMMFLNAAAASGIREGYVIELKITDNNDKTICTNVKLTEDDMELIDIIKNMATGK